MKLSEWLRAYRREHKMSMRDVAERCGFSHSYVYVLEKGENHVTGKRMVPTVNKLKRLAEMAGIPLEDLVAME